MNPLRTLTLLAPLALAGSLSAQALVYTFDSDIAGWSATTWNDGVQTIAWDPSRQALAATITAGNWHYLTNIYATSSNPEVYDALNAGFASPQDSTVSFDVTVAPGTGGTYLGVVAVLTGAGGDWNASQMQFAGTGEMFTAGQLTSGFTKSFSTDFTLGTGTTTVPVNAANYQFVIGVNSDWAGGTIYVDNVRITPAAIPEPSTVAAILGAGVLGFALYRRRRTRA